MEVTDVMWTPLQDTGYFIKFIKEKEDFYHIGVTDYRNCWLSLTSKKSFLYDFKKSNEGTDFEDETELLNRGFDMLQNPATLKKVSVLQEDRGELLSISMMKVYEFPLKLELGLMEASNEHFFKVIIQPLLRTVCDLRSSQKELRELLKKKDREIDDWRTDGRVPRRDKTNVYDDERHMKKHHVFEQNFGAEVPELLTALASGTQEGKIFRKPQVKHEEVSQRTQNDGNSSSASKTIPPENNFEQVKIEKCSQGTPTPKTSRNVSPKLEKSSQGFLGADMTVDLQSLIEVTIDTDLGRQSTTECTSDSNLSEEVPPSQSLREATKTQSPFKTSVNKEFTGPAKKRPKNKLNY